MNNALTKAKSQLQAGDITAIANKTGIAYATVHKALNGKANSRKQSQIIKAVTEFLQERKNELEKLERVLN